MMETTKMPSLDDIPSDILQTEDGQRFRQWLSTRPIDFATRRRLITLWQDATQTKLTHDQIKRLQQTATDYNGFEE